MKLSQITRKLLEEGNNRSTLTKDQYIDLLKRTSEDGFR